MSISGGIWKIATSVAVAMSVGNFYLTQKLIDSAETSSRPAALSKEDIVSVVDERMAFLEREQMSLALDESKAEYQLARIQTGSQRLYGDPGARITLQVFTDLECPLCQKMHKHLKQVVDYSQETVKWEIKHFPLQRHNPAAAVEALAIECIADIYDNQTAWVAIDKIFSATQGNGGGVGDIPSFVRSFGLNGSMVSNCMSTGTKRERINADYAEGRELGISSTPSMVVIDNQTQRKFLARGYHTPEQILASIQKVLHQ